MPQNVCATCGEPFPEGEGACPNDGTSIQMEDTGIRRDPLVGQRVGDYLIERQIGMGGMGLVYRGIQPDISKQVAIKVLRPDIAADPAQVNRLLTEARAVNAIRHRSIIDIFGLGKLPDGRQYVVMELLDGEPLDELMRRTGPMTALQALPILDEVLSALGAAHGGGVIHRDLKPSNVFVTTQRDGSRYVKLLDFGLARRAAAPNALTSQTNQGTVAGTPDYMAPEQARGAEVGPQTDLYSLGVMAFEMLTGTLPFKAPSAVEMLVQHIREAPPVPSSVELALPPEVDDLVLELLAKEMAARPPSADVARAKVKRIVRELTQQPTQVGGAADLWRVTGEHRASPTTQLNLPGPSRAGPLIAVLAFCAALAIGTALFFFFLRRPAARRVEPVIIAPLPSVPEPLPELAVEPTPPEPSPVAAAPAPPPVRPPAKAVATRPITTKVLQERIGRLEQTLRKKTPPGEAPNAEALVFLNRKKLELTFPGAGEKLGEIARYLDQWEKNYLH